MSTSRSRRRHNPPEEIILPQLEINALNNASVFEQPNSPDYIFSLANKIRKKVFALEAVNDEYAIQALVTATDNYTLAFIAYKEAITAHNQANQRQIFVTTELKHDNTKAARNQRAEVNNAVEAAYAAETAALEAKNKAFKDLQKELDVKVLFDNSKIVVSFMDEKVSECAICTEHLSKNEVYGDVYAVDSENGDVYAVDNENEKHSVRSITCGHKFHKKCIGEWVKSNNSCPLCKSTIKKLRLAREEKVLANEEKVGGKKKRSTTTRKSNKKRTMKKRPLKIRRLHP